MTEPGPAGAFRTEGMMDTIDTTEVRIMVPDEDAMFRICSDGYRMKTWCTRAELMAAIEAWVNEAGCVCDDLVYTTARLEPLRQRVRALLGLEPEA